MGRIIGFGTLPGDGMNDETFSCGIHVDGDATVAQALEFFNAVWSEPLTKIPQSARLEGVRAYDGGSDVQNGSAYYPEPLLGPFPQAATAPAFCCVALTLETDPLGGVIPRNRIYLPNNGFTIQTQTPNKIADTERDSFVDAMATILQDAAVNAAVVWKGTTYGLNAVSADDVWDTQRRRKFQTKGTRYRQNTG